MATIEAPLMGATPEEARDLSKSVADIVQKHKIDDAILAKKETAVRNESGELLRSLGVERKNEYTDELSDRDDDRDSDFIGLKAFLRAYVKWKKAPYLPLVEKIMALIRNHGISLDQESYEQESALLDSLLKDLAKPEYAEAVSTLRLNEVVESLKKSQSAFYEVYMKAIESRTGKDDIMAASKRKKQALAKVRSLVKYLNSVNEEDPLKYNALCTELAELIANLNQKIRARKRK